MVASIDNRRDGHVRAVRRTLGMYVDHLMPQALRAVSPTFDCPVPVLGDSMEHVDGGDATQIQVLPLRSSTTDLRS